MGEEEAKEDDDLPPIEPEPEPKPLKARGQFEYIERSRLIQICFDSLQTDGTFFFQREDNVSKLDSLYALIDAFVELADNRRPLEKFEKGENCLVQFKNEYSRARLVNPSSTAPDHCTIYSLDTGFLDEVPVNDIIETTDEITCSIKYQAMLARLAGIVPNSPTGYTEDELMDMENLILEYKNNLYVRFVYLNHNVDWYSEWGLNFYDVLLVVVPDNLSEVKILNKIFVEKGLAKLRENFKFEDITEEELLKELESTESKPDEDEEDWEKYIGTYKPAPQTTLTQNTNGTFDFDFDDMDEEDLESALAFFGLDHLMPKKNGISQSNLPKIENGTEHLPNEHQKNDGVNDDEKQIMKNNQALNHIKISQLTSQYKSPEVIWQQNELFVIMSIKLGDTETFYLDITETDLILEFSDIQNDDETKVLMLNFFNYIDPSLASYQKRGLNLVIRLPKLFKGVSWTRLTKIDEKLSHIKYNFDAMNVLDEDCILQKVTTRPDSSDIEFESDGESIGDPQDEFDPLEDGF